MFSGLIERLNTDIRVIKNVRMLHDEMRTRFYSAVTAPDTWANVRSNDPTRLEWQIYDHCAAFTRLYAIYEQFVEELVSEYLRLLPQLYEFYTQLPEPLLKQHRQGFGQILLKLGKEGPFRHLEEHIIIGQLSHGLRGDKAYSLLADAFFVDRQNYRFDMLRRLFSSLGFEKINERISGHHKWAALSEAGGTEDQTVEARLNKFVQYRNEAAHTEVNNIVSTEEFRSIADFIGVLGHALADIVKEELFCRKIELGQFEVLGKITKIYQNGLVAIIIAKTCHIAENDELVISYHRDFVTRTVKSLQLDNVAHSAVDVVEGTEVGVGFNQKVRTNGELRRISAIKLEQEIKVEAQELAQEDTLQTDLRQDLEIQDSTPDGPSEE